MNQLFKLVFKPHHLRLEIFLAVAGLLSYGYYSQYVDGLEPCPLCITQRFFFFLTGILGLVAFIHRPALLGARLYGFFGALFAILGGVFSSRQLWLQSLPEDQVPACGPSLSYILESFPIMEALDVLMRGDGNCAEVVWQFLGISMPGWALIAFTGLTIGWLLQIRKYEHSA